MGYLHIPQLYRDERILEFKRVFALEKIHGSASHISWKVERGINYHCNGVKHARFVELFDTEVLEQRLAALGVESIVVFGEAYGGRMQGMKATYGDQLRFVVFDVKIGESWLAVPQACQLAIELGLEFVHFDEVSTSLDDIDAARDADSVQAIRNGMGPGHPREGVVLRPPFEVKLNNGERLIVKHKRAEFCETKSPRTVGVQPEVLAEARAIAAEWVTPMRLTHVLQQLPEATGIEHTGAVIRAMLEDVLREGAGELVDTKEARKAISQEAARLWKERIKG